MAAELAAALTTGPGDDWNILQQLKIFSYRLTYVNLSSRDQPVSDNDDAAKPASHPASSLATSPANNRASTDPAAIEQFMALQALSARLGNEPSLVQGAGGNTSLKIDTGMWIKASGTWLKNAFQPDQFVPVDAQALRLAVDEEDPRAEKALDFVHQALNPSGLRPSIETTVHALRPHRVVVHVHCVNTLAHAVLQDGQQQLDDLLAGFRWSWIPYTRPGLPLAQMIRQHMKPGSNVLVLGNHGLVVAAGSVKLADELLQQVVQAVARPPRCASAADVTELNSLAGSSGYRLPVHDRSHAVALDEVALDIIRGGSLYPDHVIFLGEGSVVAEPGQNAAEVEQRLSDRNVAPPTSIIFPGSGVLMHADARPGQEALAQCLADVTLRIDRGARLHYLDAAQNYELLHWEAEHYRQQLEQRGRT